ncbi:MAG: NAD(P)/FAD-dependent oxidoreductase [Armatimonadetes bacterium]|nr:NAD(P)/FAD-dependent oxidoreductase [Armatimonadota bacterium]
MSRPRVIVIGGGPAGIVAAGKAAECGAEAILLEKGPTLGRKLCICGKGRGNITNTADLQRFIEAFSPNGKFLYGAFSRFFRDDLLDLLQRYDLKVKTERGGRVFPVTDHAADVVHALERWMSSVGVDIRTGFPARSIVVESGLVVGVVVHGGIMKANSVVIATGGASYPKTGSTGDGYALAKEAGHSIIAPEPALSALTTSEGWVKDLQGLSLRNVRVTLTIDRPDAKQTQIASGFGEMLFTHFGVSGPIILTLSRSARPYLRSHNLIVSIDLKPGLTEEQLHVRLIRDFAQSRHVGNYLRALLPRMLIDVFLNLAGIASDTPTNTITSQQRSRIVSLLKDFRLTATGLRPLEEAIVTAGGVPTKEIDPTTMMSKLVGGLYFAGEVIDIDAETGGFNLQAAFSTGSVAGGAAAGS